MASLLYLLLVLTLCFSPLQCSNAIGQGYRLTSIEKFSDDDYFIGYLHVKQTNQIYGSDITTLRLFVKHETDHRLRVHITDATKQRWEVPYNLLPREQPPPVTVKLRNSSLTVEEISGSELIFSFTKDPFSFAVRRRSNGETIFNTSSSNEAFGEMVFKDQYLEISTALPKEASLYGFGENSRANGIKLVPNEPYTLFTEDVSAITLNTGLYGSHPVYVDLRNEVGGKPYAHSVLLLNSNGMDVFYRGDSLTYKVIGGVLDFYFFAGPSPLDVVDQYTSLIGRPAAMPYWSLGFHQCRWNYRNVSVVEDVVDNYRKAKIPLDVIWNDADYMDGYKDFTLNTVEFPRDKLLAFLDRIHKIGMKYVVITDPGIGVNASYGVYQRAMTNDVFIKYEGKPFLAQVWPGPVHFPDFLNPKTVSWWGDEIRRFHELVPIDGLWIDMNEVANFCSGLCTLPEGKQCPSEEGQGPSVMCCLDCKNINNTRWDDPPYKINATGHETPLGFKTIATSAYHYNGIREYDAHSIYGFSEAIATHKALLAVQGKRPFILSRSTFVGSGQYAAHWTGDNQGTWESLQVSISTMLNFGLFGVPMVGSDICGFFAPIPEELCNRWIQVGAFYPFARNHADYYTPRKELYQWETVTESARNALGMRYKLLPYLYTLNFEAHMTGAPIARPLFFSFPDYTECYSLSKQFLLGSSLLISPVLEQGKTQVEALFPPGSWYHMFDMTQAVVSKNGRRVTLPAPLNSVNVHLYQNTILPMQQGGLVCKEARTTPFSLVVTFPAGASEGYATGKLYLDEDELPEMKLGSGQSTYVEFYASIRNEIVRIWSQVKEGKFALSKGWVIEKVTVLGLKRTGQASEIQLNGNPIVNKTKMIEVSSKEQKYVVGSDDERESNSLMVELKGFEILVGKDFNISWKLASSINSAR